MSERSAADHDRVFHASSAAVSCRCALGFFGAAGRFTSALDGGRTGGVGGADGLINVAIRAGRSARVELP